MNSFVLPTTIIACVAVAHAAEVKDASKDTTTVEALVVSVSGRSVYINVGRTSRLAPGIHATIVLASGERIQATVIDVSANSARAEIPDDATVPEVNDKVQVEVPNAPETPTKTDTEETKPAPPPHAPWTRKEGEHAADTPLLAPAFGTAPKDRPTTVRGRIFSLARLSDDLQNDSTYTYLRAGTWLEVTNPFHNGGRILFEGDVDYRNSDTFGGGTSSDKIRVKRLSYAWGLDQYAKYRGEVGRYYSTYLPELGLVDGGELALRFEDGWSFGAGAGLYPSSYNKIIATKDYGFHAFADYQSEEKESWFQATTGLQQTFHSGTYDRTLLIGRVNARPSRDFSFFGSLLMDVYTSADYAKSNVVDITQLVTQATYQLDPKSGVSGSFTRTTWPQLLRDEYANLPFETLRDGYVNRISGNVWHKIDEEVRLSARSHYWMDQDRTGFGGEISADWSIKSENYPSYYGALYYEDSSFTKGYGARLQARRNVGQVQLFAGYDLYMYSTSTLFGTDGHFVRHTLRADANWGAGRWSYDIGTDYTFGDNEESLGLSVYVQYRF